MERRNVAGGVIFRKNDSGEYEILLIQRSSNDHWPLHWEFPRGKCDGGDNKTNNESLKECLKREAKEESGLDIEPIKFIDKFTYVSMGGRKFTTQHNFLCKMKDQKQKVKLSKEHQDFKWESSYGVISVQLSMPELKDTALKALDIITKDGINISIPKDNSLIKECIIKLENNYLI